MKATHVLYMNLMTHQYECAALDGLTPDQFYEKRQDATPVSEHLSLDDAEETIKSKRSGVGGMFDPKAGINRVDVCITPLSLVR